MTGSYQDKVVSLAQVMQNRLRIAEQVQNQFSLDRPALDAWQARELRNSVRHAKQNSPFYARHLGEAAEAYLQNGDPADFTALPFTTRQDIMDAYPFGMLAAPRERLVRFGESSGTSTGKSIAAFFTADDWTTNNLTVAQFLRQVLTPEDVVAVAVPYELAGVGQDLDRALELANCTVVALGVLTQFCPPERMIRIFRAAGVTTLICSATRALHLAEVAQGMGFDPRSDLKIDKLLCAGEGASAAKLEILRQTWGAEIYPMYGMTETNTLGMFCKDRQLHLIENRSYFEVVDPETLQPAKPGEAGELVVTSLRAEALPLIRYRTGDLCRISREGCSCGSRFHSLEHLGRISDRLRVGEVSLSLLELEQAILSQLKTPPYHFGVKVADGRLQIGLTENNFDPQIRQRLEEAFAARHGLEAGFLLIDEDQVGTAVRNAVKPTISSIYLNS